MTFLNRWLSNSRVRVASKRVAKDPSARAYGELAQEYAVLGDLNEVLRATAEGLRLFPGDAELRRLEGRARAMQLEGRTRELQLEIKDAPRPALWKELCEILLEAGKVARAEEVAVEWFQATKSGEAQLLRARARAERFFADRRRDDGRLAVELVASATELMPADARPLRLHLQLVSRVGAWSDARRVMARLLEHFPGDPALEARFRTLLSLAETSKSLDQALRDVEKSGRLVDDEPAAAERPAASGSIRPLLQALLQEQGVQAAFFVRGGTALVQGPKGATAERTARGVREIVGSCRTAARKLGLGQALEVRIEGGFGTLLVAPGEVGTGAVWCSGDVTRNHEERLRDLASAAGTMTEELE
jgi:tetratricopeptide (TPR) repeat protein